MPSPHQNTGILDYAGVSRPTRDLLDGYLDWITPEPGEIAFLIGEATDSTKPGLSSHSLIVNYFKAAVTMQRCTPRALATDISYLIASCFGDEPPLSCFYGHYSSATGLLTYCNAGHHAPLLLRGQSGEITRLTVGGAPLGTRSRSSYLEGVEKLKTGDRLVAFTQGIIDSWATPNDPTAEAALAKILRAWRTESAAELACLIVEDSPERQSAEHLDRLAMVARVSTTRRMDNYDIAEQALFASALP